MKVFPIFAFLLWICHVEVEAKSVFAHFMVGNVPTWQVTDWASEINLAQEAHIDAFALNIAAGVSTTDTQLSNAFTAANSAGFKLFFSFDYAGNGAWAASDVISLLQTYGSNGAYFQYLGDPFVSTFEGPANSGDWTSIKSETGCFFIPDWSSLGAGPAWAKGVADGLFSWAAWPWGDTNSNTFVDASYNLTLGGAPYMMPVSPWFYTNLPGYNKNWLWRGDDLWYDRWLEVLFFQPEFVEIISWNDYGESHYIGPLHTDEYDLFTTGKAVYNYAANMPHDGWRQLLPFVIDQYKTGAATISQEILTAWYRLSPNDTCSTNGTSGNTASQLQYEFPPGEIVQNKVFYSALLTSSATVTVSIGGTSQTGTWTNTPAGGAGIYHGSVPFNGLTGSVIITVAGMTIDGSAISDSCTDDITNWNAWVGSATGAAASKTVSIIGDVCIAGTSVANFEGLCSFDCSYGYCPVGACTCTAIGPQATLPESKNVIGYPIAGESADYSGLCAFSCNYGYCPSTACGTTEVTLVVDTVSPFTPSTCTSGTGEDNLGGLCSYSCNYGYCPISSCTCTGEGPLNTPPPVVSGATYFPVEGLDEFIYGGLCNFTCPRGYCPDAACTTTDSGSVTEDEVAVCVAGTNNGVEYDNMEGLCSFACSYGFCPTPFCTCTNKGAQVSPPAYSLSFAYYIGGADGGLCTYTCSHGYCPDTACVVSKPQSTVTIANQTVLSGELKGDDLVTDIFKALNTSCPSTGCTAQTQASISNINYGVAGTDSVQTGTLVLTVEEAYWALPELKETLIFAVAAAFNATATGSNCAKVSWTEYSNPCLKARGEDDGHESELVERVNGPGCPIYKTYSDITCHITGAVLVQIEVNDASGIPIQVAMLDVSAAFEGSVASFTCDDFIDTVNAFLDPLGSALDSASDDTDSTTSEVSGWIGDFGSISTVCDDLETIISWFSSNSKK